MTNCGGNHEQVSSTISFSYCLLSNTAFFLAESMSDSFRGGYVGFTVASTHNYLMDTNLFVLQPAVVIDSLQLPFSFLKTPLISLSL